MADKIPVLRVFDDDGKEYPIPAIKGRKGDKGDPGEGDMNASVYDPQGKQEDVFAYVDDSIQAFAAEYGVTPYADVEAAYNAGKAMFVMKGKAVYPFYRKEANRYCFVHRGTDSKTVYCCMRDNTWGEEKIADLPVAHAERHGKDGDDPISPADINAVSKSGDTMTGDLVIRPEDRTAALRLIQHDEAAYFRVEDAKNPEGQFAQIRIVKDGQFIAGYTNGGASVSYPLLHTGNVEQYLGKKLGEYVWRTRPHEWRFVYGQMAAQTIAYHTETATIYYTDAITVDKATGAIVVDQGAVKSIQVGFWYPDYTTPSNQLNADLPGKYWALEASFDTIFYSSPSMCATSTTVNQRSALAMQAQTVTVKRFLDPCNSVVYGSTEDSYPDGDTVDAIYYEFLGKFDDRIANGGVELVTHTGDGEHLSANNHRSIKFDYPPKLMKYLGYADATGAFHPFQSYSLFGSGESYSLTHISPYVPLDLLTTEFSAFGLAGQDYFNMKKSADGRAISWYGTTQNTDTAFNVAGYTYYFLGLSEGGMF